MSKRTNKYGLTYFEQGDITNAQYELQRWETLDAQLEALFSIMGNGVLTGWNIGTVADKPLSCVVFPGSGHVGFVAVESTQNKILNLVPNSINYVYAQLTIDSYWTKKVNCVSFVAQLSADNDKNLYLGHVITDGDSIVEGGIDITGRKELGFIALINNAVASHKHNGGEGQSDPIDLSKEVQGIINQNNLPELDASIIQAGTIDTDRLPLIDHETKIINTGMLTHAQIDSYIETLSLDNQSLMGEVSTINLLQLILSLKHIYPDIDEFLVNEIAFIPGVSPDDYIDFDNTTADVDTRTYAEGGQHTISGAPSSGFKAYTKTWDTKDDFSSGVLNDTVSVNNTTILDTTRNELDVDTFNSINSWSIFIENLSSIDSQLKTDSTKYISAPNSAKLTVDSQSVEVQLLLQKTFNATDWSSYDFLSFYLYTESVEHGDLFFYISDSVYGEQNSAKKVLTRNSLTVDEDTLLNGWQEIVIDLRSFQRGSINRIGFYVSTQEGWDTSKGFDLNIDSVKLSSGNLYQEDGYIRVNYGSELLKSFWRLRWDSVIPSDTMSNGVNLQARTRVANTEAALEAAIWSSYFSTSGSEIELPVADTLYKYIQIEMYFTASVNYKRSAVLKALYLDYYIADAESSFELDSQSDWENGQSFNLDTMTTPGSIMINGNYSGDYIYGSDGYINQTDSSLNSKYTISGTILPVSINQAMNALPSGFGMITGVSKGENGNVWLADIDNDRVVEIDLSGSLVRGFYGSYLTDPLEVTTTEETTTTTTTVANASATTATGVIENPFVYVLSSVYNYDKHILYIVFDKLMDINLIPYLYIKTGSHRIEMTNMEKSIVNGNILAINISGSDATVIDKLIEDRNPVVSVYSPTINALVSNSVDIRFSTVNYDVEYGYKIKIDSNPYEIIYTNSKVYSGLSNGSHTVEIKLLDENGNELVTDGSTCNTTFLVYGSYSLPYITILNPIANQIYSSTDVNISFSVHNFPVLNNGQHLRYQLDTTAAKDHYTSDPIILNDLEFGLHNLEMWFVDENGTEIVYTHGRSAVSFIVGYNLNSSLKLYTADNISSNNISVVKHIDIANIKYMSIYAPIDVQLIPPSYYKDYSTILISKLR